MQAIAGVAPESLGEVKIMTVWPSNAAFASGRFLGHLYSIEIGAYPLTLGNLLALASIPHALFLYFWKLLPIGGMHYMLTNRRVVVKRDMWSKVERKAVELDRFDAIDVVVRPGQAWYNAGDLIFRKGNVETFRLDGVSRPETFRQTCLKAHAGYVGAKKAESRQPVLA